MEGGGVEGGREGVNINLFFPNLSASEKRNINRKENQRPIKKWR